MWQCHLRYHLATLACGLVLSVWPLWAATPEDEQALALLKTKAEQFQRFLLQKPVFLSKEDFRASPTGQLYYHVRLMFLRSHVDMQRSNSLASQFLGYLKLVYAEEDTRSCGDLMLFHGNGKIERILHGFTTYEGAMAYAHNCFHPKPNAIAEQRDLTFLYQDGRWIFKDAIRPKDNHRDGQLLAALGRAEPPHHRVADNLAWEALVK
jgi:hypothetical protein